MARNGSDDATGEDEGNLVDPLAEDDMKINLLPEEPEGRRFSPRRILLLVGLGVVLIGGAYLANQLFLSPAPPPPTAPSPVAKAPTPVAKAPAPAPSPAAPPAETKAPTPAAKAPVPAAAPAAKAPAPAKAPTEAAKAPVPAKAPATAKPAPSLVPPSALAKAEKAAPVVSGGFSLQVGAMAVQANAENLKKKLDTGGFPSTIRKGAAHLNKHVVTVGEPSNRREAEEMGRRLNVDGFPSEIVALEGKYTPQVGAFFNLDEAIDLARAVQKKQYRPKITQRAVTTEVYQVRHGEFDSRAAAMKRGEELKAKGFSVLVVRN